MRATAGLQVGSGNLIGADLLAQLKAFPIPITRIDLQEESQGDTTALAQEVLAAGLTPLCIIRRPEQMKALPDGVLIELGNEPDLAHFGWTFETYREAADACVKIALQSGQKLYIGAISNLNTRGFDFLRQLPWKDWPASICCSIHRYPDGHSPLNAHAPSKTREQEIDILRSIVGNRPLACTEVGYHDDEWTEAEVAEHMAWERNFFSQQGFEICSAYNINDGSGTSHEDHYGFRRLDNTFKPVAAAFAADPVTVLPPVIVEGPVTTLRTANGFYLCAESGGGSIVATDRLAAAEWEQWHVVTHDDGRVSIQSSGGRFIGAADDKYTVVCDAMEANEWEKFGIEVRDDVIVCFYTTHGTFLQAQEGGGDNRKLVQVPHKPWVPGAWEFFTSSDKFWHSKFTECQRPLKGTLRAKDKLFVDDMGNRRVFFDSDFNLLRKLRDEPSRYYSSLGATARRYQGTRQMPSVGGWMDFWAPLYGVYPITFTPWIHSNASGMLRPAGYGPKIEGWTDFDALWRKNCQEHRKRKLRMIVSFGDCQIITPDEATEIALHERIARICAEEGGSELVVGWEIANEIPQNYPYGLSTTSVERQGRVIAAVRKILPHTIFMQGAGLSEEPDVLYLSSTYGEACSQHTSRQPPELCCKRTYGLIHWEGNWRHFPKPFWMMEPAGMNVGPKDNRGDDMYAPWTDKGELTCLYALHAVLGMASNMFTGADIRGTEEGENAWGYDELSELFDKIFPEDIALWDHKANDAEKGITYFYKGKDFRAPAHKNWNTTPPFPIKEWTFYQGDTVGTGTGTPPAGSGVIVGTFR